MAIGSIKVTVDRRDGEYSRWAPSQNTLTITAAIAGNAQTGDVLNFTLRRVTRPEWGASVAVAASKPVTALGGETSFVQTITLGTDDLNSVNMPLAHSGAYTVEVSLGSDPIAPSSKWVCAQPITISLVTVQELRSRWTFGVSLVSTDTSEVRTQPNVLTGCQVVGLAPETDTGPRTLVLTYNATGPVWTLAWDSGPAQTISPTNRATYDLLDGLGENWLSVDVQPSLLPTPAGSGTQTLSETLLVQKATMSDAMLASYVTQAVGAANQDLRLFLEPTLVTTDPIWNTNGTDSYWDYIAMPVDYYPQTGQRFLRVKLTNAPCLRLLALRGYFSSTKATDVPSSWWNVDKKTGLVSLIPSSGAIVPWITYGNPLLPIYFNNMELPHFWHYQGWFGLERLDGYYAIVRELIAREAAKNILIQAGLAYAGGIASQSTSRDGLSNSKSLVGGMYGPYTSAVADHTQWLQQNTPKIKQRLRGVTMVTLNG